MGYVLSITSGQRIRTAPFRSGLCIVHYIRPGSLTGVGNLNREDECWPRAPLSCLLRSLFPRTNTTASQLFSRQPHHTRKCVCSLSLHPTCLPFTSTPPVSWFISHSCIMYIICSDFSSCIIFSCLVPCPRSWPFVCTLIHFVTPFTPVLLHAPVL